MNGFPSGTFSVLSEVLSKVCTLGRYPVQHREKAGPWALWWRSQLAATCPAFVLGVWLLWRIVKTRLQYGKIETFPFLSYFRVQLCTVFFISEVYASVLGNPWSLGTFTCCCFCSGRSLPALEFISLEACFGVGRSSILQPSGLPGSSALLEHAQGLSPWRTGVLRWPVILE